MTTIEFRLACTLSMSLRKPTQRQIAETNEAMLRRQ